MRDVLSQYMHLRILYFGGLAQLGEHLPYKQGVGGSIPSSSTIFILNWSRGVAVNMPACHAGDRRFDPGRDRHFVY